jgi:hypothetical protein
MLERSKGAGLIVGSRLLYSTNNWAFLKEVLTKHASRIRELDLSGLEKLALFDDLPQSSLRLHSLKLTCVFGEGDLDFPTGVLETANLRTLMIRGCYGPWCSLSLPALTNLKLHYIPNRPSSIEFFEMLRGMAALEVLDMQDSLPLANDFIGQIKPIELPHLSRLCLLSSSNYQEVTNILSVVIVPPTATLEFNAVKGEPVSIQEDILLIDLASSLSTFFSHLGQDTNSSYSNLHVFTREIGCLQLEAWKDNGGASATPDLQLVLSLPTFAQNMLRPIFPPLSLFNITSLILDIDPVDVYLEDTFGQLSRLQNVKVVGNCTGDFIRALTSKPQYYKAEHSAYHSVSFPALQSLWIETFSFGRSGALEDLQNCLMERCERRAELLKLKLTDCSELSYKNVGSLREIVIDVEWDGYGEIVGEESKNPEDDYYYY